MFHPRSSWHPRYQILHSNLGQKRELPTVFLQKIHIHPQPPLETKAKMLLWAATFPEAAAENLAMFNEHEFKTFTFKQEHHKSQLSNRVH